MESEWNFSENSVNFCVKRKFDLKYNSPLVTVYRAESSVIQKTLMLLCWSHASPSADLPQGELINAAARLQASQMRLAKELKTKEASMSELSA